MEERNFIIPIQRSRDINLEQRYLLKYEGVLGSKVLFLANKGFKANAVKQSVLVHSLYC